MVGVTSEEKSGAPIALIAPPSPLAMTPPRAKPHTEADAAVHQVGAGTGVGRCGLEHIKRMLLLEGVTALPLVIGLDVRHRHPACALLLR